MHTDLFIVDDSVDQVYLMETLIKMVAPELSTRSFHSGEEALAAMKQAMKQGGSPLPKVVLLDLNMPGKNGLEVLAEIKKDPRLQTLPVCLFSNGNFKADVQEAYRRGASFYFIKPEGLGELKKFLETFIALWFHFATL